MVQSATGGKQFVCSRCQLLCCRLISWLCVYSHQWIYKDCFQTRNVKVDVWVIISFFTTCEIHFSGFIDAWDSKGILHTLRDKQVLTCLLCEFISPEVLFINLFEHLRILLVGLGNSSAFLGLPKWVRRFEGKFRICWRKQELARTCRGKTLSVLKLAVDSVNFALCNQYDNFACPLLVAKKYMKVKYDHRSTNIWIISYKLHKKIYLVTCK